MTIIVRALCLRCQSANLGEHRPNEGHGNVSSTRPSNNRGSLVALRGGSFGFAERFGQHRPPRRASSGDQHQGRLHVPRRERPATRAMGEAGGRRSSVPGRPPADAHGPAAGAGRGPHTPRARREKDPLDDAAGTSYVVVD